MRWFKMWTEARNDAKLRLLSYEVRWIWFSLLCYAAEQPERGTIKRPARLVAIEVCDGDVTRLVTACNEMMSLQLVTGVTDEEQIELTFPKFAFRQSKYPSDDPDRVKARVQKHRAKQVKTRVHVTRMKRDVTSEKRAGNEVKRPIQSTDYREKKDSFSPSAFGNSPRGEPEREKKSYADRQAEKYRAITEVKYPFMEGQSDG